MKKKYFFLFKRGLFQATPYLLSELRKQSNLFTSKFKKMTLQKNLIGILASLLVFLVSQNVLKAETVLTENPAPYFYLFLPSGTAVSLELNESLNSEEVEIGQVVNLRVRSNVVVNGRVVIRAGSFASGRVSKLNKSCNLCSACDNACSSLTIVPDKVSAADGSQIFLEGTPLTAKGQCCGIGPAILNSGTALQATVRDNVKIYM